MTIDAISGAGMTMQSNTIVSEPRTEVQEKDGVGEAEAIAKEVAPKAVEMNAKEKEDSFSENGSQSEAQKDKLKQNKQIRKAVEDINKSATGNQSMAIFGIHEKTNRVTVKIVDKKSKEVIKEYPPEKTLDMIAKVWEMAGIMVDEKR